MAKIRLAAIDIESLEDGEFVSEIYRGINDDIPRKMQKVDAKEYRKRANQVRVEKPSRYLESL